MTGIEPAYSAWEAVSGSPSVTHRPHQSRSFFSKGSVSGGATQAWGTQGQALLNEHLGRAGLAAREEAAERLAGLQAQAEDIIWGGCAPVQVYWAHVQVAA